jgi:hypothetical protein
MRNVNNQKGTILMAGTLFAMFSLISIGVAYSLTQSQIDKTVNQTSQTHNNTERLTKALERYYLANCYIGSVDINSLVGNYIESKFVTTSFSDYTLSIANNSGVVTSNVSFTFLDNQERGTSNKTVMAGSSVTGNVLTMTKIITDQRNRSGESVSIVSGNNGVAGCL